MCCKHECSEKGSCLHKVPVFEGMNQLESELLQKVTHSREFKKGELIFRDGETSETLFVVNSGLIGLTKISAEGKEQIVRILFPGDFFGLFALLRNEKHYVNAVALGKTTICFIHKQDFLMTMERNSDMSFRFLLALNDRLQEADESVSFMGLMEVEQRLSRALLLFHDKMNAEDGKFTLPISKKDLASFVGTTPETISRKLVSFVSQNIIKMDGQRFIQIVDYQELTKLAGH